MTVMKVFRLGKNTSKYRLNCFIRHYCNDKSKNILQDKNKNEELLREAESKTEIISKNSTEECAIYEQQAMKQVLVEKERDANLQSRLSKDCKILFSESPSKPSITKCGAIRLDQINLKKDSPDWISYDFKSSETKLPDQYPQGTIKLQLTDISNTEADSKNTDVGIKTDARGDRVLKLTRIVRQEPGKVLLTFIPEEWWRAFIPKTGVTGLVTFFFTLGTFLVSKEYYVLEHNYYHGLSVLILWAYGIKFLGPKVAKFLDKGVDEYEKKWIEVRELQKQSLENGIIDELHGQFQADGQLMVIDAKRENVLLQLEEEYRIRQMYVYDEVKRRLDYHVAVELAKQRVQQKNLLEYVTKEVVKAITPEMQDKLIYYSIDQIIQDMGKEDEKK